MLLNKTPSASGWLADRENNKEKEGEEEEGGEDKERGTGGEGKDREVEHGESGKRRIEVRDGKRGGYDQPLFQINRIYKVTLYNKVRK